MTATIEHLLETHEPWRKWPEHSPPAGEAVLVWHVPRRDRVGGLHEIGVFDPAWIARGGHGWYTDQGINPVLEDVYWMPLPEPP